MDVRSHPGYNIQEMVPVLWDTGNEVSRRQPCAASSALLQVLKGLPRPVP